MPRIIFRCGIEKARSDAGARLIFGSAISTTAATKQTGLRRACRTLRYPSVCELCMASECHIHTKVILFCECVRADGKHIHTANIPT